MKPLKLPKGYPWHEVKKSQLHGTGVFAIRDIPNDTLIIEYTGKRISAEKADQMWPVDPNDPYHTFFFSLSNEKVIDGEQEGNDARWINHSCEPNCETRENEAGSRVFIYALRDIKAGEELTFDYALTIDDELTEELKNDYLCLCQTPNCRGTMLALNTQDETQPEDEEMSNH